MKLVIVDDEPLARERLRRLVADLPDCRVTGEAGDGESALACVRDQRPDVVLLDIRMPGVDGLAVARALADEVPPPAVIFVTAYDQHALSAFDAAAAGYLLKPVRAGDLAAALARAQRPSRAQLQSLAARLDTDARRYVHAHTREGEVRIPVDEVIYFQAEDKYIAVRHLRGEVLIESSLRALENELGQAFLRVHRKALVAKRFIRGLRRSGTGGRLALEHADACLPVSRRRLGDVRRLLAGEE